MQHASKLFTAADQERIRQAVQEAESRTSAEIVPVVASASSRYERAEDLAGLCAGVAAMLLAYAILPDDTGEIGAWGGVTPLARELAVVGSLLVGFLIGTLAASHIGWLKRLFTRRAHRRQDVEARAEQMFFHSGLRRTAGGTGVLLYVSLFERMAVVLADRAVLQHLGQKGLEDLCAHLTTHLKDRDPTSAIAATIKAVGDRLAPALPAAADINELPDVLVTID